MTAQLIVRAKVQDVSVRDDFDQWYEEEHLQEAIIAFAATAGWRGWSEVETDVHFAFYQFDNVEQVREVAQSAAIKSLIAKFDQRWGSRVTRSRDIVEISQQI